MCVCVSLSLSLSLSLSVSVCVRVFFCMTLTSRNLCELRKCCCRFRGSSERNVHLAGTVRVAGRLAGHSSRRERRIIWKLRRHLTVQLKSDALDHELASRVLFSLACSYVLWLAHGGFVASSRRFATGWLLLFQRIRDENRMIDICGCPNPCFLRELVAACGGYRRHLVSDQLGEKRMRSLIVKPRRL